jgi:hypothetical protein
LAVATAVAVVAVVAVDMPAPALAAAAVAALMVVLDVAAMVRAGHADQVDRRTAELTERGLQGPLGSHSCWSPAAFPLRTVFVC